MENNERIKLYQSIYNLFCKYNIIDIDLPDNYIDSIALAREKRILNIEPVNDDGYLLPFWTDYKDGKLLFFPTPPYSKKPIEDKLNSFILDTRKIINEMMSTKPDKIILDLRCNNGGFIHVFYNALFPLIPKYDGLILSGVDLDGKEVMRLEDNNNELLLSIKDPVNGKMEITKSIIEPSKCKYKEIEILVNSRTASSAEMIMIMFAQKGYKVIGEPTMGLTSGMFTQMYINYSIHVPYYWFKDLNGKIYNQTTRPDTIKKVSQMAKLIEGNVIAKIPEKIINSIDQNTLPSLFTHIHCKFLNENAHFGIDYDVDKPEPIVIDKDKYLYIFIPENGIRCLSSILSEYSNEVFKGKPVIIDIRNAKLKGDDAITIFNTLFKPYEIPLRETKNEVDKLGSFYLSGSYPYITLYKAVSISKYANINVKLWINKNSIIGDCKSVLVLKYLINVFNVVEGSTFNNYFDYSFHKYLINPYNVSIYTSKY